MNNINSIIEMIINAKNNGGNPQAIMQNLMQRNPNYQQTLARLQNMAQGRNPQEFIMQLAKQNGISEKNINSLTQMFSNK